MYCRYCGKEIADNSKFCNYCGENLDAPNSMPRKDSRDKNVNGWKIWEILLACGLFVAIVIIALKIVDASSIEGKWYIMSEYSNNNWPESEFNFMSDGSFIGTGSVGGTYAAENGELILYYNPLYGTKTYEYKVKGGRLYLYKGDSYMYVYSRTPDNYISGKYRITIDESNIMPTDW